MSYLLVGNETTQGDHRLTVLSSGSIALERGEFVTRLGPSDCGETAFRRAIDGSDDVTSRYPTVCRANLNFALPHRRDAGMAFSDWARLPHRGIFDDVAPCFKPRGVLAAEI